jgi:hypothetical protein
MPKKWVYVSGYLLILLTAITQVHAGGALEQKHQYWESRVIVNEGQAAFRALTDYTESGTSIVLAIDRYPNDCSTQYISLIVLLPEAAKSTIDSKQRFGALRVDELTTRNINFTLTAKAGERFLFVNVTNFDKETTLLGELTRGTTLRFKLTAEGREFYLRFSLLGFTSASTRSLELCNQANNDKSDKRYFYEGPKTKSDKSYF